MILERLKKNNQRANPKNQKVVSEGFL